MTSDCQFDERITVLKACELRDLSSTRETLDSQRTCGTIVQDAKLFQFQV